MTPEINTLLTILECTLLSEEQPSYIEVSYQSGFIYILLSKPEYKNYSLSERINGVFNLLKYEHSAIIEKYPVIVECLSEDELTELFTFYV